MHIGAFEIREPVPELRKPHVIASLRPWVDAGSVGSMALSRLERQLMAQDLGNLATPGRYFDFTRYRPMTYYVEEQRRMSIPNTILRYASGGRDFDFIFLHMLEPHAFAEEYIESITELFKQFKVRRYCRLGGMYDAVPHTRPLLVMATANGEPIKGIRGANASRPRSYQGPTSIMNMVGDQVTALGVENMSVMVRLPQYVQLEEDRNGSARLLNVLCDVYDFLPPDLGVSQRGIRQYERVTAEVERNPGVLALVQRLESDYDARLETIAQEEADQRPKTSDPTLSLAPSIEEFLRSIGGDAQASEPENSENEES
ncbi:MAG: PAC2 family protein [Chloroflexi bacterium]|nr:PAC2 family protein [Chloroflexota bacterium]